VLLSSFPEDGTPLAVFESASTFNIHLEKPYAKDFISLSASFDLKWLITTSQATNWTWFTHAIASQTTFW